MSHDAIGQTCALLAAGCWSVAVVLFKMCGERMSPIALNVFKNSIAIILLVVTLPLMGEGIDALVPYTTRDILLLSVSGVLGIALADTAFFHALNRIGVGMISIVECTYSPLIILVAVLWLGEVFTGWHMLGTACIVSALFLTSGHKPAPGRTTRDLLVGIALGVLAMALMAVGIVMVKPLLDDRGFPLIWATLIRMFAGTAALAVLAPFTGSGGSIRAAFRAQRTWWFSIPASILGGYLAMIFWVAGFKYTQANVAAVLNQTSTVFAMVLATVILRERFTWQKGVSLVLALTGVIIMRTLGASE